MSIFPSISAPLLFSQFLVTLSFSFMYSFGCDNDSTLGFKSLPINFKSDNYFNVNIFYTKYYIFASFIIFLNNSKN